MVQGSVNENANNNKKLILELVIFVFLLGLTIFGFIKLFLSSRSNTLDYKESSRSIYTVKLKQNDYYESDRLPQVMNYIASLIDDIEISYNYLFSTSEKIDYKITYSVDAITKVYAVDGKSILYEKKETLLDSVIDSKNDSLDYNFAKDITVDYNHFNELAKKFKASYSLNTTTDLTIVLNVRSEGKNSNYRDRIDLTSKSIIVIPLTEKTINISINSDNISNEGKIIGKKLGGVSLGSLLFFILSTLGLSIITYVVIKTVLDMMKSKTKYELSLSRILKENDSIIANVENSIDETKYETINVSSFEELRDIHDNINAPILFSEVVKGKESRFTITNDNILYLYTLKDEEN